MRQEDRKTVADFLPKNWPACATLRRLARAQRRCAAWNRATIMEVDDATRTVTFDGVADPAITGWHEDGRLVLEVDGDA